MDPATRGQTIKRARRRHGYSQSVLAGLVGRSESWLSQVERGILSVDSHEILTRLARVLRLDLTELTGTETEAVTDMRYDAARAIERAACADLATTHGGLVAGTFSPIPELNLLKEFYDTQDDYLAPGFEMYDYGAECYQDPDPELAERLVYFAQANGSGSLYGFWRRDDHEDLATQPVVAIGDEGGIHLIARNFREFLRLLASLPPDCEPDIDWNGFGVRALFGPEDDGYEPLDNKPFLAWLDRTFGITPADEWESVVDDAEAKLGREWATWIRPIVPDAVWSPVHELNLLKRLNRVTIGGLANGFWLVEAYGEGALVMEQNGERKRLGFPVLAADLELFATNDSDTFFALWRLDDRAGPASLPVVAVGKEAGAHVVARDVPEFLSLVAGLTDTEIRCDGDGVGLRVCEPADKRAEFLSWLEEACGLCPAVDPAAVIETAQVELGERLVLELARG